MLRIYGRLLGDARTRWVLAGLAVSVVGDGAARVAVLLRVHDEGGGSSGLAAVLVLFALPSVLLAGVAGLLADRPDPRPIVIGAAALQLIVAVVLALTSGLAWTGGSAFVLQTGFALANSAWMVALPRLVPAEDVGSLVSMHHGLVALAAPSGAALGGLLVQHVGTVAPFVLDAVTFIVLMGAGLALPSSSQPVSLGASPGFLRVLLPLDGLAALRQHRLLAVLAGAVLPFIVAIEAVNAIEVFLVRDVLGGSSAFFGFSEGVAGVAAGCGALLASAARTTRSRARTVLWALIIASVMVIAEGLAPSAQVYVVLAASVGFVVGGLNAVFMTLMVTDTDPATRGRVVAFVGGAARSCGVVALAVGGLLGTILDPRESFVAVGVVALAIGLVALWAAGGRRPSIRMGASGGMTIPSVRHRAGADFSHDIDGDGHRPRQRSRGGAAPQRGSLPGQDRDHRRGEPVELPRVR